MRCVRRGDLVCRAWRAARGSLAGVAAALGVGLATGSAAAGAERVEVPSVDAPAGAAIVLPGFWFAAPAAARPAAAVVLLHGCSGPYDRRGALGERMASYAERFNAQGLHALVIDSLSPRGERELCTQRAAQRRVTPAQRRLDAYGALAWLAARPEVDPARLGLVGWSHGGSTVLAASDAHDAARPAAGAQAAFAVAFYPGCRPALAARWQAASKLLLMIGSADDWTPAEPCRRLAARQPSIELVEYEGAYHGFDGTAPLRLRADVPGGVRPGAGVHVGGNDAARAAALVRLDTFLLAVGAVRAP